MAYNPDIKNDVIIISIVIYAPSSVPINMNTYASPSPRPDVILEYISSIIPGKIPVRLKDDLWHISIHAKAMVSPIKRI